MIYIHTGLVGLLNSLGPDPMGGGGRGLTQYCPAKRQSQVHRANEPMFPRHLLETGIYTTFWNDILVSWPEMVK